MEYSFHVYNKFASDGVTMSLEKLLLARQKTKTTGAGLRSHKNKPVDLQKKSPTFKGVNEEHSRDMEEGENPPIIVCVGSDLAIGDSLGPITGSMLRYKTQGLRVFVYGTLAAPVTAKEIGAMRTFLKETHPNSPIIAVDAAVGNEGDVGLIRLYDRPLFPGAGANKSLGEIGDFSIMGIVAEKSVANYSLLNATRLNLVYTMSEIISDGLASLAWEHCGNKNARKIV